MNIVGILHCETAAMPARDAALITMSKRGRGHVSKRVHGRITEYTIEQGVETRNVRAVNAATKPRYAADAVTGRCSYG